MAINRTVPAWGAIAHGPNPRKPLGVDMPAGAGGVGATSQGWTPTVVNLLVLLVVEIAAFAAIRYAFRVLTK